MSSYFTRALHGRIGPITELTNHDGDATGDSGGVTAGLLLPSAHLLVLPRGAICSAY